MAYKVKLSAMETATALKRKVKAPHPSTSKHRANVHRRPPPLPPKPSSSTHSAKGTSSTLPIKNLQGIRTRRTDSTKDGWERDVVFVTRNTPLGALMGRCRGLIMDEGSVLSFSPFVVWVSSQS